MGVQKNGADPLAQPWDMCNTNETNKWVTVERENAQKQKERIADMFSTQLHKTLGAERDIEQKRKTTVEIQTQI